MQKKALVVGGCPHPFHRLEPIKPLIETIFESMGIDADITGITHPDGGDDWAGDYASISKENLSRYDLLLMMTTGNERRGADVEAIIEFVQSGKSLIGIHNATDTFTDHAEFVRLIGGRFRTHPAQLEIETEILNRAHPITEGLENFSVRDELYLFSDFHPETVDLLIQTRSFDDNGPVPFCWTRVQGLGRVFYLSLGHNPSTIADPNWQTLFKRGVAWSLERS